MKLNLLVQGALFSSQSGFSAWRFAKTALLQGHQIEQVFFYQDAVAQGNINAHPLSDEFNAPESWAQLHQDYSVELVVCISAAERRGILNQAQASELGIGAANLSSAFTIAGLGALHEASLTCDRLISFK